MQSSVLTSKYGTWRLLAHANHNGLLNRKISSAPDAFTPGILYVCFEHCCYQWRTTGPLSQQRLHLLYSTSTVCPNFWLLLFVCEYVLHVILLSHAGYATMYNSISVNTTEYLNQHSSSCSSTWSIYHNRCSTCNPFLAQTTALTLYFDWKTISQWRVQHLFVVSLQRIMN